MAKTLICLCMYCYCCIFAISTFSRFWIKVLEIFKNNLSLNRRAFVKCNIIVKWCLLHLVQFVTSLLTWMKTYKHKIVRIYTHWCAVLSKAYLIISEGWNWLWRCIICYGIDMVHFALSACHRSEMCLWTNVLNVNQCLIGCKI